MSPPSSAHDGEPRKLTWDEWQSFLTEAKRRERLAAGEIVEPEEPAKPKERINPGACQVLPLWIEARRQRTEGLVRRAFEVIGDGMRLEAANRGLGSKFGRGAVAVDAGPDHRVRQRAAELTIRLATVGRPVPKPAAPSEAPPTFEEILEVLRTHREKTDEMFAKGPPPNAWTEE